jgi:hypothetical protein
MGYQSWDSLSCEYSQKQLLYFAIRFKIAKYGKVHIPPLAGSQNLPWPISSLG